jgi:hypothetical protein
VLNRQFHQWLETDYNARVHSTLQMKPIDRFGMDLQRIRFLDPMSANDELFYLEETRSVRKDNTFSVGNIRYEAPRNLSARQIQVRFNRASPNRIVVFYKGERMGEATRLDFLANDRAPGAASRPPAPQEYRPPAEPSTDSQTPSNQ